MRTAFPLLLATGLACAPLAAPRAVAAPPPPDSSSDAGKAKFIYTLTTGDSIRVQVTDEPDLASAQKVDVLGNINLPYIGQTHVAGLTRDQAAKAIEKAYIDQQYLRNPQVTISIDDYAERDVSIQGMVKNPGRYLLPNEGTMSVVELVTKAGGFTDIAKGTDVIITRNGGPGGKKSVQHVDVKDIIEGKSKLRPDDESLMLQPGDIVYVPESLI